MLRHLTPLVLIVTGCADPGPRTEEVGGCDGRVQIIAEEAGIHVPMGSVIDWSTNPPATGEHYQVWAAWDRSYENLDRGFWVHNLEHGGIVYLYNCPGGCQETVDKLVDSARVMDPDGACVAPVRNRAIVTSDPLLPADVQVAVVAWDVIYTATCFDPFVKSFAKQHYARGPEDLCNDGIANGGTFIDP